MFLPFFLLSLAVISVVLATIIARLAGVSVDVVSIVGALALVLGAILVGVLGLLSPGESETESPDSVVER
jgi:hypothetical protein